jgi:hypothetical protein
MKEVGKSTREYYHSVGIALIPFYVWLGVILFQWQWEGRWILFGLYVPVYGIQTVCKIRNFMAVYRNHGD